MTIGSALRGQHVWLNHLPTPVARRSRFNQLWDDVEAYSGNHSALGGCFGLAGLVNKLTRFISMGMGWHGPISSSKRMGSSSHSHCNSSTWLVVGCEQPGLEGALDPQPPERYGLTLLAVDQAEAF